MGGRKGGNLSKQLDSITQSIDLFGIGYPSFTNKGKDKIHTVPGCILSVILMTLFFLFSVIKFRTLTIAKNPIISTALITGHFDSTKKVKYDDLDFKLAVGIIDYFNSTNKAVTDYIKFMARYETNTQGVKFTRDIPLEICNRTDY